MTQSDHLISFFRKHNYRVTLGQILNTTLAAEYRARMSELRKHGFVITCTKAKTPSENTYVMFEPDPTGQLRFI